MKANFLLYLILSTLILWCGLLQAKVTISIDRNPVRVNESFQLYFEADESIDGDPDFSPLQQHFQILNRSRSSNISIINGKYQRSQKWTLRVIPKQEGDFILPSIKFGAQKSDLFRVKVKPASQSSTPGEGLIFEITSDESSVYVQSQLVVTLRLMSDSNISGYQMGELAIDDMDVVIEPLGDVKQYETRLDDKPYLVLEMQFALFPQESGSLNIGPIIAEVQYGGRARSIFDPFQTRAEIRRVSSEKIALEVLARPDSFNAAHWFPSTDVELSEEWQGDLNQLTAGEPITRVISLSAVGLTAAQLPEPVQADIPGIKQYPDKPVFEDQRSSEGINGIRRQRTAIIPTGAGRYTLPEIAIPWWNLETGQQEIAKIPSRTIEVQRAEGGGLATESGSEIISETDGESGSLKVLQPEPDWFWRWISLVFATGWALSILIWWLSRKGFYPHGPSSNESVESNLPKAKKRLRRACEKNNAADARDAILAWANALIDSHHFINLNQVTRYFGSPLKRDIDILNRSIYSETAAQWKGDSLWQICEEISDEHVSGNRIDGLNGLRPLNP